MCTFCMHPRVYHYPSPISSPPELESEPSHFAPQVFRPLLRPVWWEEHPRGGDEQRPAPCSSHAPQVRPERFHLQEASVQEGEGEGQAHIQRSGFHARHPRWTDAGPGHLQCTGEDSTERLPGEQDGCKDSGLHLCFTEIDREIVHQKG